MEKEKDRSDEPCHEPAPERDDVKVAGNRCPYCHEDVPRETADVCRDCLARHHAACWAEAPRCGTCGCTEVMRTVTGVLAAAGPDIESARASNRSEATRLRIEAWSTVVVGVLLCGGALFKAALEDEPWSMLLAAALVSLVTWVPGLWMLRKLYQVSGD